MAEVLAVTTACRMCTRILIRGERWSEKMPYEIRQRIIGNDEVIEVMCPHCGGA